MSTPGSHTLPADDAARRLAQIIELSGEMLAEILAEARAGVAIVDLQGRFLFVNAALAAMNGLPVAAHIGRTISEVIPTLAAQLAEPLAAALRGERAKIEIHGHTPAAPESTRSWDEDWLPVTVEGSVLGAIAIVREQTDIERTRAAMTEAYARLEAVFDTAPVSLSVWDVSLNLVLANDRMQRWNNLNLEHAVGRPLAEIIPGWRDDGVRNLSRALAGERFTIEIDRRAMSITDGPAHVQAAHAPIWLAGRIVGVVVASIDISARVEHERTLETTYAQLQALFDASPVSLAMWDAEMRLTRVNDVEQRWNQIDLQQSIGRTIQEIAPGWGTGVRNLARALAGERFTIEYDRRAIRAPGGPALVESLYAPIHRGDRTIGVVIATVDVTERAERSRALDEAYAQLEAIFATAPVSLSVWDRDLRLLQANDRWHEWLGIHRAQPSRVHADDIPAPERDVIRERFRRAFAGEHLVFDVNRRSQGRVSGPEWAQVSYAPVQANGEVIGVIVVAVDITERVQRTRALDEAYAQLEAVFDNVPVAIAVYDRHLRIIGMNDRMARWNGLDRDTAIGKLGAEVFDPQWALGDQLRERALAGQATQFQVDRHGAGQLRGPEHVLASYTPIVVDGEVIGITVSSTDISDSVEHAREMGEAYAQLEAVFDNVNVGIAVYDRDFRIVRMNRQMARWNGTTPEAAIGRSAEDVHTAVWQLAQEQTRRALAGEACSVEIDRKSAGLRTGPDHVLASYTPVRAGGEVIGITVASTDITARVEAAGRAETAIQFRDDVLSIASHELRTPLTSIIGFAERLERDARDEQAPSLHEAMEDLTLIRSESQRMARTLDLLLDLVGLAAGAGEVEREPVSLTPLLRRQLRMVGERHPLLHLEEDCADDLIVESDPDPIAQIISNLLENAAKYAGDSACVTVRARANGQRLIVEVEDDGPGIPIEQQRAVFERRYRGHTGEHSGLGLGLYLSRIIATRLGGSLTLRSQPGHGATFTLALPAAHEA